ncbi:MAG: hypothetical protein MUF62_08705 [Chitinophagaceae bacterium]|jgi:hypothetical protein|nr:hypothetical protein [Chitinophagaceae bacterium]
MNTGQQYTTQAILSVGSFHAGAHPAAGTELRQLFMRLLPFATQLKADMLISFLRKKSLRLSWVKANLPLAKAIVGSDRQWPEVQKLLNAYQYNDRFCFEFDAYVRAWCGRPLVAHIPATRTHPQQSFENELQPERVR